MSIKRMDNPVSYTHLVYPGVSRYPEFEHQALQAADEQLLQIGFQKMLALRDTEKLQDIRVADDLFGRSLIHI